jgi:hypothetical protein
LQALMQGINDQNDYAAIKQSVSNPKNLR